MSKILTDRTDGDIKNKWYSMARGAERRALKRQATAVTSTPDTSQAKPSGEEFEPKDWSGGKKSIA